MSDTSAHPPAASSSRPALAKARQLLREETAGLHLRLHLAALLARLLPRGYAGGLRAGILRRMGFAIGRGTALRSMPRLNGGPGLYANLSVGAGCVLHLDCTLDLEERIVIGDRVTVGHQAMILTSSHEIGPREHRAGDIVRAPVTIGDGAWLGPRCIILPGVTVGAGAIVAAGALVNKDVPPHTRAAGAPARVVEQLERDEPDGAAARS